MFPPPSITPCAAPNPEVCVLERTVAREPRRGALNAEAVSSRPSRDVVLEDAVVVLLGDLEGITAAALHDVPAD
jgi:hypothetical protein